jgi:hypothetical protein
MKRRCGAHEVRNGLAFEIVTEKGHPFQKAKLLHRRAAPL